MIRVCANCSCSHGRRHLPKRHCVFADRDSAEDTPDQGHCLVLAAAESTSHGRFSTSHVGADGARGVYMW